MPITDTDMKAIGEVIRRRRIGRGLSARQLARMVGVSDTHVMYIEKAQRVAAFDKLANILTALGLTVEGVLAEIGQEGTEILHMSQVPVVTLVTAGQWREVCDAFEPGDADEWIDTDVRGENVFALKVSGDSMEPEFHDGDIIIVDPGVDTLPNDFVVVKNEEGEATFKQLKKYGSRWVLHPLNPNYQDMEVKRGEFMVIGRVVKNEKRY
jgi:SOS-response transcriptional repressor LexA